MKTLNSILFISIGFCIGLLVPTSLNAQEITRIKVKPTKYKQTTASAKKKRSRKKKKQCKKNKQNNAQTARYAPTRVREHQSPNHRPTARTTTNNHAKGKKYQPTVVPPVKPTPTPSPKPKHKPNPPKNKPVFPFPDKKKNKPVNPPKNKPVFPDNKSKTTPPKNKPVFPDKKGKTTTPKNNSNKPKPPKKNADPSKKSLQLTDLSFEETITSSNQLVVVDFGATWCGPCRILEPVIDDIATKYEGKAVVAKVDVDDSPTIAKTYNIIELPTILYIKNGVVLDKQIGGTSPEKIESKISTYL